jgi:hypothetical protein
MKRNKVWLLGILCEIEPNEHNPEFWDVFITAEPRQALLTEWIVRGAITRKEAIQTAQAVIWERLKGRMVWHDAEGGIHPYQMPQGPVTWIDPEELE